ncbi:hypothetical protein CYMTET_37853 [Cymbomonas tetramitiformis]|uniref:Uncharacterized protein n=1 Tax=Cymbomonas tetramitiformis TaxID=36881 RepID=A0AAE0F691_9CHLO|nr:hypothetical protein CYMTET_37853 [Cymbomonas tetramitiformis]
MQRKQRRERARALTFLDTADEGEPLSLDNCLPWEQYCRSSDAFVTHLALLDPVVSTRELRLLVLFSGTGNTSHAKLFDWHIVFTRTGAVKWQWARKGTPEPLTSYYGERKPGLDYSWQHIIVHPSGALRRWERNRGGGWFLEDATQLKAPVAPFSLPISSMGRGNPTIVIDDDEYRGIPYTGRKPVHSEPTDSDDSGTGAVSWSKEKLPDSDDNDDAGVTNSKEKLPGSDDNDDAGVTYDMDTASPKWEPASPEYDDTEDDVSEFDDLVADDAEEQAEARRLKRLGLQLIMDEKGELIWVPKGTSPTSPVQPEDPPITEQESEAISEDAPASVGRHAFFSPLDDFVDADESRLSHLLSPDNPVTHPDFDGRFRKAQPHGRFRLCKAPPTVEEGDVGVFRVFCTYANRGLEWIPVSDLLGQAFDRGFANNIGGHRHTAPFLFDCPFVCAERDSLTRVLFFSGIDKASNTWMVRCIRHERAQAWSRLSCPDFSPCMSSDGQSWLSVQEVICSVSGDLALLFPEVEPFSPRLPYLFSLFKEHKGKHRWLTNAHDCIFSPVASIVQQALQASLEVAKLVASELHATWFEAFGVRTQLFPLVSSLFEMVLNLPDRITSVFSADVERCFEAIPVAPGPDSLQNAANWVLRLAFSHQEKQKGSGPGDSYGLFLLP